jgi:hypothetical protein
VVVDRDLHHHDHRNDHHHRHHDHLPVVLVGVNDLFYDVITQQFPFWLDNKGVLIILRCAWVGLVDGLMVLVLVIMMVSSSMGDWW